MLDRKTKDIDANIELLEDRLLLNKKFQILLYIIGMAIAIIGIVCYFYTGLVGLTVIITFLALFVLIGFYHIGNYIDFLKLLIYFKKKLDKEVE